MPTNTIPFVRVKTGNTTQDAALFDDATVNAGNDDTGRTLVGIMLTRRDGAAVGFMGLTPDEAERMAAKLTVEAKVARRGLSAFELSRPA